jgi:hypothetical protein
MMIVVKKSPFEFTRSVLDLASLAQGIVDSCLFAYVSLSILNQYP